MRIQLTGAGTYLSRRDGGDDQIQRPRVLSRPVLILIRGNVRIRTQLQGILLLVRLARDTNNTIRTHRLSEHNSIMSQSTNTNHTNPLPRPASILPQRRVSGNPTTQHRRSLGRRNPIRDLDNKPRRRAVVQRISTIRGTPVQELAVVGTGHVRGTVLLTAGAAFFAVAFAALARFALGADADAVADFDVAFSLGADTDGGSDDFVADAAGVGRWALHQSISRAIYKVIRVRDIPIHSAECAGHSHRYRSR